MCELVACPFVAIGSAVDLIEGLIHGRIAVSPAVELVGSDVARVPEIFLIGIRAEAGKAADPTVYVIPAAADPLEQRIEGHELSIDRDADLLVLLLSELEDRLADRVWLIR